MRQAPALLHAFLTAILLAVATLLASAMAEAASSAGAAHPPVAVAQGEAQPGMTGRADPACDHGLLGDCCQSPFSQCCTGVLPNEPHADLPVTVQGPCLSGVDLALIGRGPDSPKPPPRPLA